jgi:hypothetical protein
MAQRRFNPFPRAGALLLLLFCAPLAGSIDEQQFACEEALKHVEDCCGASTQGFNCGSACTSVDVSYDQADWLRNASCDDLEAANACADPTGESAQ